MDEDSQYEQPLPDPQSEPDFDDTPHSEVLEHVDVVCGGCQRGQGFDIKPETATFTFICGHCKTRNEWSRI